MFLGPIPKQRHLDLESFHRWKPVLTQAAFRGACGWPGTCQLFLYPGPGVCVCVCVFFGWASESTLQPRSNGIQVNQFASRDATLGSMNVNTHFWWGIPPFGSIILLMECESALVDFPLRLAPSNSWGKPKMPTRPDGSVPAVHAAFYLWRRACWRVEVGRAKAIWTTI